MALFNRRNRDVDNVPQEVQEYYQAEKRDRTGIAWLLALGTLVATILLAVALFFGGRWIYRSVFDNDKPQTAQQQAESREEQRENQEQQEQSENPTPTPTPTPPSEPTQGTTPPSQQVPNNSTPTPNPPTTPRTGPEGPEDSL